jgi:hypothetical protein
MTVELKQLMLKIGSIRSKHFIGDEYLADFIAFVLFSKVVRTILG